MSTLTRGKFPMSTLTCGKFLGLNLEEGDADCHCSQDLQLAQNEGLQLSDAPSLKRERRRILMSS